MRIDEITNGIVIDHIKAGKGMQIYHFLRLGELDCPVAIIKNVTSHRMGKKDLIKVDTPMDIDLDVLGYIDEGITVNVIKDGKRVDKLNPHLPQKFAIFSPPLQKTVPLGAKGLSVDYLTSILQP